jgi:hypothetical protein
LKGVLRGAFYFSEPDCFLKSVAKNATVLLDTARSPDSFHKRVTSSAKISCAALQAVASFNLAIHFVLGGHGDGPLDWLLCRAALA